MDRRHVLSALTAGAAILALPVSAQSFPTRPVRIIPFGTGGGPIDGLARIYAEKLQKRWGQSVLVEPRPGASGTIAANAVATAAPDGYTVMFTLPLTHIHNAILQSKLPYDPVKDFEPITQIGVSSGPILVTRADAPYSNLKELIAYAKAHPGMTYGTWGNGSQAHLMGELLSRKAGITLIHAPYKAEAAAHIDMIGGALDFAWANPATAHAQAQGGKMKLIGVAGARRQKTMPDLPTFGEQGLPGFDIGSWIGVYAPAKTPPAIIDQWNQALRDITRMPDVQTRLVAIGFEPLGNSPAEFKASVKADFPRIADLIKAAGVTPE